MLQLLLVRHADPDYTTDSLTDLGRREASALAERMVTIQPDVLLSSPFGRARETASFTEVALGVEATVVPWAGELVALIDVPGLSGVDAAWNTTGSVLRTGLPEGPASIIANQLTERMEFTDAFLATQGLVRAGEGYTITSRWSPRTVVVVCHAGFATAWVAHLLGLPIEVAWSGLYLAPSSVTTILFERREPTTAVARALSIGDTSHLYARPGVGANYQGLQGMDWPSPVAITDNHTIAPERD